jgi:carboxyl-terminal processing protease
MAGVMKDYGLTTLVGEHTYGKASVQNVLPFRDGSAAKLTIARYYLPSGVDISRKIDDDGMYVSGGIRVDVEVKLKDNPIPVLGEPTSDNQLAKAMEIVKSKMSRHSRRRAPRMQVQDFGLMQIA